MPLHNIIKATSRVMCMHRDAAKKKHYYASDVINSYKILLSMSALGCR